jgi:predicted DNA-binding transcriptional regulator YafY
MARNSELVRQWEILRAIDGARVGIPVTKLAADRGVHPRTIRRDIDALSRAGFPLYDEPVNGTPMWRLGARPFRSLESTGLGLTELAALYFGHAVLTREAGAAFENDGERALMKVGRAMPASSRRLVDELPRVLSAKKTGRKKCDERKAREVAERALDAIVRRRRVAMRYASASSHQTKEYEIEPQRLSCADGGVYLAAWVPAYGQLRNFAIERIQTFALNDAGFEPRPLPAEPFANSIGAFSGLASQRIEIEFDASAAGYVRERLWHRSQQIVDRADGSIVLQLEVSIDPPLRSWVLSFGAAARVLLPSALAGEIADQWKRASERYRAPIARSA